MRTSISAVALLGIMVLGCARSAPPLPTASGGDIGGSPQALSSLPVSISGLNCQEIYRELEALKEHDSKLSIQIQGNRSKNQAAGYIGGVLFLPALLATESDKSAKAMLDHNQITRDHLIVAQRAKRCSVN